MPRRQRRAKFGIDAGWLPEADSDDAACQTGDEHEQSRYRDEIQWWREGQHVTGANRVGGVDPDEKHKGYRQGGGNDMAEGVHRGSVSHRHATDRQI